MSTNIKKWFDSAVADISAAGIGSARLDARLLLEDTLEKPATWILAHMDEQLTDNELLKLNTKLAQRLEHEPLAYIRGWIEFYGRRFQVTPEVLIPRPETEALIDMVKQLKLPGKTRLLDVGTGSGNIGLTLALELPNTLVTVSDISPAALDIARRNAAKLGAKPIRFVISDLLEHWLSHGSPRKYDIITANLPYVSREYEITPDAKSEPELALYAEADGYSLIELILPQAAKLIRTGGYLALESDPWQQERIIRLAQTYGFELADNQRFHLILRLKG